MVIYLSLLFFTILYVLINYETDFFEWEKNSNILITNSIIQTLIYHYSFQFILFILIINFIYLGSKKELKWE